MSQHTHRLDRTCGDMEVTHLHLGLMGQTPAVELPSLYPEAFPQKSKMRTVELFLPELNKTTQLRPCSFVSLLAIPPPEASLGMFQLLRRAQTVV